MVPVTSTLAPPEPAIAPRPSVTPHRPSLAGRLRADLRGMYIIWYRDVLRYVRDRIRIVTALGQPILYLFIFGTGLSSAFALGRGGSPSASVTYVTFMFPGVLAMTVIFTAIFSAMSIVWDREFGFLREILVAPISRPAVAIGKALGGSTVACFQGGIVLLLGPFVGVPLTPGLLLQVVPLLFLLSFCLSCVGIAIASRMKTMEGFQVLMNFFLMPMIFLSGAFFPVNGLPGWLMVLTRVDPAAYGVDPIRRAVLLATGADQAAVDALSLTLFGGTVPVLVEVLVLAGCSALALMIAVRWFARQE
ncbi:MAG: ABC transporter permease [Chloroflexi bacterium]|nr:ABC transporter permease [Chloroflexota bacterium]